MEIGGDGGTAGGLLIVGNVLGDPGQAGSTSTGVLRVKNGGGLTLAGGTGVYVGTTLGAVREVAGPDVYVSRATGTMSIDGTLRFTGAPGFFGAGYTNGGITDGAVSVGALDMGLNRLGLTVGSAGLNGQAVGRLTAGSGDLLTTAARGSGSRVRAVRRARCSSVGGWSATAAVRCWSGTRTGAATRFCAAHGAQ